MPSRARSELRCERPRAQSCDSSTDGERKERSVKGQSPRRPPRGPTGLRLGPEARCFAGPRPTGASPCLCGAARRRGDEGGGGRGDVKREDQREDDGEELTHQGRWARRLPRGSDSEASARTQGERGPSFSGSGRVRKRAGAGSRTEERGRLPVFRIKKAEKRTVNGVAAEVSRHIQACYCRYQKDAGRGKGRRKKTLSSFEFLFSFLKTRHLRDRAEDYFCLFWETMLVSLDSNQPGSREASSRGQARLCEAASGSHVSVGATRPCRRAVRKDGVRPLCPRAG